MTVSVAISPRQAYAQLRQRLLAERADRAYWLGRLSDSALSTAVGAAALHLADANAHAERVRAGLRWIQQTQNADGGWGDTPNSPSNLSTTVLVVAARRLCGCDADPAADAHVAAGGDLTPAILSAYGDDRTFSVPILTMCAIAGMVDWRDVPALPFELAAMPRGLFRFLRLPVVSYALPALISMGLVRHAKRPPRNPVARAIRRLVTPAALRRLERIQPDSGGFLEAAPLTGFVAMSLIAAGRGECPVVGRCAAFLAAGQRENGSWPIDENLSVWNTTMAVHAVGGDEAIRDWLLARQHRSVHPYTGSPPGGWGWSHLPGSVPDADDSAGAMLALATLPACDESARAAAEAARWLLGLQNRDGGWPTFCRGWGKLPFDRGGCDLTAHVLRALHAWRDRLPAALSKRAARASRRGLRFLARSQRTDGSWLPLWFGSQRTADQANPVFGTARVLLAYNDLGLADADCARRGRSYLRQAAGADGGWGAVAGAAPTIEESAVAVEALAGSGDREDGLVAMRGVEWLCGRLAGAGELPASPIGLYFARLWYSEILYPISLTAAALRRAIDAGLGGLGEFPPGRAE